MYKSDQFSDDQHPVQSITDCLFDINPEITRGTYKNFENLAQIYFKKISNSNKIMED